jgi:hypothetical protein
MSGIKSIFKTGYSDKLIHHIPENIAHNVFIAKINANACFSQKMSCVDIQVQPCDGGLVMIKWYRIVIPFQFEAIDIPPEVNCRCKYYPGVALVL